MRKFIGRAAVILCCLLVCIAVIGYITTKEDNIVAAPVVAEKVLVPGGQTVGVRMDVRGVLIVGLEEIENNDGEKINPGILSGLQIGDIILSINGESVYRADEIKKIANNEKGTLELKIQRNNKVFTTVLSPVKSRTDGLYKLGVWIKDKTAGIGTLTYYDPVDSTFGALGHGIVDPETNSILTVETGQLLEAQVQEVKEGKSGEPGEIKGMFYHTNTPIGCLKVNSKYGVFGEAYHPIENNIYSKPIAIGTRQQVEKGKAYILSTVRDNETRKYEIEIEKIQHQDEATDKGMIIHVTDEELIDETGGIVQGMSGSPIVQNDRIIGAVTHVFVNDPTRGYGIFIEWMLDEAANI